MAVRKYPNKQRVFPEILDPSQEEIENAKEELVAHYRLLPGFNGDPIQKTHEVIEACKVGWRNCPKTFGERIRVKAKVRHAGGANLRNWGEAKSAEAAGEAAIEQKLNLADPLEEKSANQASAIEEIIDHIGRDKILRHLNSADRKFWKQREKYYRVEFEFNSSSDFALLLEVISNEIKIQKIHEMEFQELERKPDADGENGPDPQKLLAFSKMTAEAHKQLQDSLRSLGVTRDQRKGELESGDGDIASISITLDRKLAARAAVEEAYKVEEDAGLRRKQLRGDVYDAGLPRAVHNRVPDVEEIQDLIKEAGIVEIEDEQQTN